MSDRVADSYIQDETGQWYCLNQRSKRRKDGTRITVKLKVFPRSCSECGEEFVNRHPQKFCSNACRVKFDTGRCRKQEPARQCPICSKDFMRKVRSPWRKTCGDPKCVRALADQHPGYLPRLVGEEHPNWKGGKRLQSKSGYVYIYAGCGLDSRLEHRVVMEEILGRPLQRFEEVHHKNAIRNDNRPENLELWARRQPTGARVKDLIEHARWVLETYGPIEDRL
ncbi:HNH endonuclease [Mycobacteroides abscessus subsp. abscessus]|uniref:HNH endonuclease n=1 Tax=Mycobacteroides abscessus TaxID=36809 RepID=UPI00266C0449|nr:HNH endonuclease [Mycobacteroides abscessus]MDO3146460.1 HNH endonuclease [Mycobacteroides abscessus subsp. abscessus]